MLNSTVEVPNTSAVGLSLSNKRCRSNIYISMVIQFLQPSDTDFLIVLLYYVIQLRECLEPEVYELFHKKLTEQALIKDPKFLWCCHVST